MPRKQKNKVVQVDGNHKAVFKAKVIHTLPFGVSQTVVAETFCISQSLVSEWLKNKEAIISDGTVANKKLIKKQKLSRKYNDLYPVILILILIDFD